MAFSALRTHSVCLLALASMAAGLRMHSHLSQDLPPFDFGLSKRWDFSAATLTQNNLGGKGPDSGDEAMVCSRFARFGDLVLDLRITVQGAYWPSRVTSNRIRGPFAQINVDAGTNATLKFELVESGTSNPFKLDRLPFTVWDLDHGKEGVAAEYVGVGPVERYYVSNDTTVKIQAQNADQFYTFTATTFGQKNDNPKDPYQVTAFERSHAVTLEISDTSSFLINFAVTDGNQGRNLLVSGDSALAPEPDCTCPPTPAPAPVEDCKCSGDPHITAFDGSEYTALAKTEGETAGIVELESSDSGEFWLVKNEQVQIQGRYFPMFNSTFPFIRGLAVSGPFLKGNTLVVRSFEVSSIRWNNGSILEQDSKFEAKGLMTAIFDDTLESVDPRKVPKQQRLMIYLPLGIRIQVDRNPQTLAFKISMPPLEGGQDGQCGNHNGKADDDTKSKIQNRFDWTVKSGESLFEHGVAPAQTQAPVCDCDPTPGPPPTCKCDGDPHISAFDGSEYTALAKTDGESGGRVDLDESDIGEFWLVKNEQVKIQGRYMPLLNSTFPFVKGLAVGGPFLKGNTLVIRPLEMSYIRWNNVTILHEAGSTFEADGLVKAVSNDELKPVDTRNVTKQERLMIELPLGIRIQVDRNPQTIAVEITMPQLEGGQDGQCGNNNGLAEDDTKSMIKQRFDWRVKPSESVFEANNELDFPGKQA